MEKVLVSVEVVHRKSKTSLTKNRREIIRSDGAQGDGWTTNRTDRLLTATEEIHLLHESSLRIDEKNIAIRRLVSSEE